MTSSRINAKASQGAAGSSATRHHPVCRPTRSRFFASCIVAIVCHFAAGESRAEAADAGSEGKFVTGRLGAGALVDSRYSGAAGYQTFPVPLASVEFGDFAYIDYWQAGLYLLSNQQKTLGLAIVATPRLGFNSSDGSRLAGIMTRKSSIESGLSIDYGADNTGVSLGYLHDITGANIPRSPCTLGWRFRDEFQLGQRASLPAPIMAEPVLEGIADRGSYVWRGWSGGSFKRPTQ